MTHNTNKEYRHKKIQQKYVQWINNNLLYDLKIYFNLKEKERDPQLHLA